jgi:iron complex transport system substrate-binding protein
MKRMTSGNKFRFLFFLLVVLFVSGCKPGEKGAGAADARPEGALTDVLGRAFSPYEGGARRIVSLSPGVTEILFAIGAGERVVGITEYCNYPPEAQDRIRVGGFAGATVSMERIAALKTDLVIISGDMHGRILALLENLGIPAFAVEPRTFEDVFAVIETMGLLADCREGADETVRIMKEKLEEAALLYAEGTKPTVYWELSEEPLISAGKGSFVGEALSRGGGINIFEDLEKDWPLISGEEVLIRRPEWILTGDDHGRPEGFALRPGWAEIPAVKNGRIVVVNADRLYRYGPRLADAVLEIAAILNPSVPSGGLRRKYRVCLRRYRLFLSHLRFFTPQLMSGAFFRGRRI